MTVSSALASQLNQFSQNIQQFNAMFIGDDAEAPSPGEPKQILLNPEHPHAGAAMGHCLRGRPGHDNQPVPQRPYHGPYPAGLQELLSQWWDIDSKEELTETLAWLFNEGHRIQYDIIWQAMNTVSSRKARPFSGICSL